MKFPTLLPVLAFLLVAQAAPAKDCQARDGKHHHHHHHSSNSSSIAGTSTKAAVSSAASVKTGVLIGASVTSSISSRSGSSTSKSTSKSSSSAATSKSSSKVVSSTTSSKSSSSVVPPKSSSSTVTSKSTVRAVSSSSSSASSSSTPPSSPTASAKRAVGLAWGSDSGKLEAFTSAGSEVDWYYNWAYNPLADSAGLEYVAMVWGSGSVSGVKAASAKWKNVTHVLGFNEPNIANTYGGSDMTPANAATLHQQWVSSLSGGNYLIGSPAVARGGKKWMNDWLAACAGKCKYDYVPFHYYGTDVNDLISYTKDFAATFNKPLWLTEFACTDYSTGQICSAAQAQQFMDTAIAFFRSSGLVERWSWFGAFPNMASGGNANGIENTDGSANALGKHYITL